MDSDVKPESLINQIKYRMRKPTPENDLDASIATARSHYTAPKPRNPQSAFRDPKTMTTRDVTGFYAFFFARKSGNFLRILGRFPY